MNIYPAIDLMSGQCVRLRQGNFLDQTVYSGSPIEVALDFESQGSKFLHVVDLDGARQGCLQQFELLQDLACATSLKLQVGGGIRTAAQIEKLLNASVDRVVIGSMAVTEQQTVAQWLELYGSSKLVLALDVVMNDDIPYMAIAGWQKVSKVCLWDLLTFYEKYGVEVLCTDISHDGILQGPNFKLYTECNKRFPNVLILVSGGIRCKNDILKCASLRNISGAIIGRALYEKQISLGDILC